MYGHFQSEIGLGRAARLLVRAFDSQSIPLSLTDIPLKGRQNEPDMLSRIGRPKPFGASLTVASLASFGRISKSLCRQQTNIAYPFWELHTAPASWRKALEQFDAFWAPSVFIRDMLLAYQEKPVYLLHQPVALPAEFPEQRQPDGILRCITFFDFDSYASRKNPMGAVNAFRMAFAADKSDVELVIKMRGGNDRGMRAVLHEAAAKDRRIRLIDGTASRAALERMLAASDVFISLHRSEGFGFGCAEALAAGKIVVATDYSGTADFITPETGFPVAWRPVAVSQEDYHGAEAAHWAEPEIEDAAEKLRTISNAQGVASLRARAGFELLKRQHSFNVVGQNAAEILRQRVSN